MEDTTQAKQREMWDRLVLLLITEPRAGWELQFEEITRREIERLSVPMADTGEGDE
jgi:hypothetical protein